MPEVRLGWVLRRFWDPGGPPGMLLPFSSRNEHRSAARQRRLYIIEDPDRRRALVVLYSAKRASKLYKEQHRPGTNWRDSPGYRVVARVTISDMPDEVADRLAMYSGVDLHPDDVI